MNSWIRLVLAGAVVMAATGARAHFLWATLSGKPRTFVVTFQEHPGDAVLDLGERSSKIKGFFPKKRSAALKSAGASLKQETQSEAAGAALDYGVLDKREEGRGLFWLRYYAKAAISVPASQTDVGLPFELSARKDAEGNLVVHAQLEGRPVEGAEIVVAGSTPSSPVQTDRNGNATVKAGPEPLAIRALVTQNRPGSHEGNPYELVRIYSTLTVGGTGDTPLTTLIQEAFGDDHEVVQRTAFIQTVLAGKVTRAQLQDHLRQRALIHEAVDKILHASSSVPYRRDQQEVIDLLRNDIDAIGAKWPTGSEARPLTKAFLAEVEESKKRGPYFALGVFHVYYGGITHGGRDIGAKIKETLGTDLAYYQMSDGYREYAEAVNEIRDPDARREMIRGGLAAYRYIIRSNNEPIYRSNIADKSDRVSLIAPITLSDDRVPPACRTKEIGVNGASFATKVLILHAEDI